MKKKKKSAAFLGPVEGQRSSMQLQEILATVSFLLFSCTVVLILGKQLTNIKRVACAVLRQQCREGTRTSRRRGIFLFYDAAECVYGSSDNAFARR